MLNQHQSESYTVEVPISLEYIASISVVIPEPPAPIVQATQQQYSEQPVSSEALTYDELVSVLLEVGWPEHLISQAVSVSSCESKWNPNAAGDHGTSYGLFQLKELWFRYAGTNLSDWRDPYVNAYTALQTYYYDINRGQAPWKQWTCKPH